MVIDVYQLRDYEVIDYQMYTLGESLRFRGPQISNLETGKYIVCIGAAQTFGCFCSRPFPTILQEEFNLPVLNLGLGGVGPYFFLKYPELFEYINKAKFAIVQVMSGRSESNSLFESDGLALMTRRSDGVKLSADDAYKQVLEGNYIWQKFTIGQKYIRVAARIYGAIRAVQIVAETRNNWVNNYRNLLKQIEVPKILFWFSKRYPDYQTKYNNISNLFNAYPQMVNQKMIEQIKDLSDEYVECVSDRGTPQRLISRFTGKPTKINSGVPLQEFGGKMWTHNSYYPSPEMHEDAAESLKPACLKLLSLTSNH
jgi:hypothetical protein